MELVKVFSSREQVIDEIIKDILHDLKDLKHDYIVLNDKIAYKDQDEFVTDIFMGYKTIFAYFTEFEKNTISKKSLEDNIYLGLRCGNFSYAEIVKDFRYIMGVTGTLKTLSEDKKNIMREKYQIERFTYIPSVFGENKR